MNAQNAAQFLPIVQAMAEGKTIQLLNCDTWMGYSEFSFDLPVSCYRIKPEPKEIWATPRSGGGWIVLTGPPSQSARTLSDFIHYREVVS